MVDRRFFFDAEPTILDSKVVGWPGIETRAKGALREMAFSEVSRTYYPALYPAPGNRKILATSLRWSGQMTRITPRPRPSTFTMTSQHSKPGEARCTRGICHADRAARQR